MHRYSFITIAESVEGVQDALVSSFLLQCHIVSVNGIRNHSLSLSLSLSPQHKTFWLQTYGSLPSCTLAVQ